jgi:hypothetical protein
MFRKAEKPPAPPIVEVAADDCYTVDLFTEVSIEQPAPEVPSTHQQVLGEWGGGAWNDVWCHGLLVTKVYPDGRADLVDMHAPYEPWKQPATAFRRVGRIDDQGNLRFAHGTTALSYRIEDGKLIGNNRGQYGNLTVELNRVGEHAPTVQLTGNSAENQVQQSKIPTPKPVRMSQFGAVPAAGG